MSEIRHRTMEEAKEEAKVLGLIAVFSTPHEVFIDRDTVADKELVRGLRRVLRENGVELTKPLVARSKSGGVKRHVYYHCNKPLSILDRITIQAVLGSDPIREILSWCRAQLGEVAVTVLFETKVEYAKVVAWRKQNMRQPVSYARFDDDVPF